MHAEMKAWYAWYAWCASRKGFDEEINGVTSKQYGCLAQYDKYVGVAAMIMVMVNGQRTIAKIDPGAMGNFISRDLVRSVELPTRKKKQQYDIEIADGPRGSMAARMEEETSLIPVAMQGGHHEEIVFDVVGMVTYHAVLGVPWVVKHKAVIDWMQGVVRLERSGVVISIHRTHR